MELRSFCQTHGYTHRLRLNPISPPKEPLRSEIRAQEGVSKGDGYLSLEPFKGWSKSHKLRMSSPRGANKPMGSSCPIPTDGIKLRTWVKNMRICWIVFLYQCNYYFVYPSINLPILVFVLWQLLELFWQVLLELFWTSSPTTCFESVGSEE